MQDLSVNELADEVRDSLIDQGVEISRTDVRRLVRHFFKYVEKVACTPNLRLNFRTRDINYIYPIFDVKSLCDELAVGTPGIVTVDYLMRKGKLSRRVVNHLRNKPIHLEDDIE